MDDNDLVATIRGHFPAAQAVYLFGSHGTEYERVDSDVDLAVLLPHAEAKRVGSLCLGECWHALVALSGRQVDLVNLRQVNTVFQHEIVQSGRLLFSDGTTAAAEFEMLTMSLYQKLNEERREIIADFIRTRRAYNV